MNKKTLEVKPRAFFITDLETDWLFYQAFHGFDSGFATTKG